MLWLQTRRRGRRTFSGDSKRTDEETTSLTTSSDSLTVARGFMARIFSQAEHLSFSLSLCPGRRWGVGSWLKKQSYSGNASFQAYFSHLILIFFFLQPLHLFMLSPDVVLPISAIRTIKRNFLQSTRKISTLLISKQKNWILKQWGCKNFTDEENVSFLFQLSEFQLFYTGNTELTSCIKVCSWCPIPILPFWYLHTVIPRFHSRLLWIWSSHVKLFSKTLVFKIVLHKYFWGQWKF